MEKMDFPHDHGRSGEETRQKLMKSLWRRGRQPLAEAALRDGPVGIGTSNIRKRPMEPPSLRADFLYARGCKPGFEKLIAAGV